MTEEKPVEFLEVLLGPIALYHHYAKQALKNKEYKSGMIFVNLAELALARMSNCVNTGKLDGKEVQLARLSSDW